MAIYIYIFSTWLHTKQVISVYKIMSFKKCFPKKKKKKWCDPLGHGGFSTTNGMLSVDVEETLIMWCTSVKFSRTILELISNIISSSSPVNNIKDLEHLFASSSRTNNLL